QQPSKKRDRTPPREDRVSPTAKKGKQAVRLEPRRRSPQGLKLMTRHVSSSNHGHHENRGYRTPTPPRQNNSPPRSPVWSDEDSPGGPLSREIMSVPLPPGLEKPPQLGTYNGLTDPGEHIENIDVLLNYRQL
ncbi:hypothetical protein A2U01_0057665, partial [Trifolium medium]|nr:hypothetical protein [Trifolium medium]